jgi:transcriptional regulator with XRE-family HTH domain
MSGPGPDAPAPKRFREMAARYGVTYADVARAVGVTRCAAQRWAAGACRPAPEYRRRLNRLLAGRLPPRLWDRPARTPPQETPCT